MTLPSSSSNEITSLVFLSSPPAGTVSFAPPGSSLMYLPPRRPALEIRTAGVKVGTVVNETLDQKDYQAVVEMKINTRVKLPTDTAVRISSAGLLGGKYIKLEPGGSKDTVPAGGELKNTKDVISLEELLGKVIFLVTGDEGAPK